MECVDLNLPALSFFLISNLKLLPDDYEVLVSPKLISQWNGINNKTKYWIALEKNSSFNN